MWKCLHRAPQLTQQNSQDKSHYPVVHLSSWQVQLEIFPVRKSVSCIVNSMTCLHRYYRMRLPDSSWIAMYHPVHTNCPGLCTGAPMKSRVTPQWQMSYFQVHLKILPTSGTIQSPNSIIPYLAQWSSECVSAPPHARSLKHLSIAIQWSSGGLENSSGSGPSHPLQVA